MMAGESPSSSTGIKISRSYSQSRISDGPVSPNAPAMSGMVLLCPTTRTTASSGKARTRSATLRTWASVPPSNEITSGLMAWASAAGRAVSTVRWSGEVKTWVRSASPSATARSNARRWPASDRTGSALASTFSAWRTRMTVWATDEPAVIKDRVVANSRRFILPVPLSARGRSNMRLTGRQRSCGSPGWAKAGSPLTSA